MTSFRIAALAGLVLAASILNAATVRLGSDVVPVRQSISVVADPRADGYRGSVRIDLDVKKPTAMFRLHAKDRRCAALYRKR